MDVSFDPPLLSSYLIFANVSAINPGLVSAFRTLLTKCNKKSINISRMAESVSYQ